MQGISSSFVSVYMISRLDLLRCADIMISYESRRDLMSLVWVSEFSAGGGVDKLRVLWYARKGHKTQTHL
jgi:hypothetical protein